MKEESSNILNEEINQQENPERIVTRRKFFGNLGKAAITAAAAGAIVPFVESKAGGVSAQRNLPPTFSNTRRAAACYQLRVGAAQYNFQNTSTDLRPTNNDESIYPNKIASYSKALPHNSNGEVNLTAYNLLLSAIESGEPARFEQIPLGGTVKLTNPQSGLAFDMEGADSFSFVMPPPPAFSSREIAAEISENYWMALLRDVPFSEYGSNPIAAAAAQDLTTFGADFKGAKNAQGQVTPDLLFRGLSGGDKAGPYLSQFFYLSCNFGANKVNQKIQTVKGIGEGGQNYMTDFNSWLAIQNGAAPQSGEIFDPVLRYMRNGRDIGQWVHIDVLFQAYFHAFLVLSGTLNAGLDSSNPYANSSTQIGFGTFGGPHIASMMCEVATRALKTVWNQKWFVHRRLRPEVFAARVDRTAYHNANYPVHAEILDSVNSSSRLGRYLTPGNALLPMAFPEGSPTHPSYGAGHATVAGACTTILKAFFDESTVIENPVQTDATGQNLIPYTGSDTLTVGGELNKVASNVALGRNIAGVHWRSDGTESLKLGEDLAISILRDQKGCFSEQFAGFTLTKFDGTTVVV